MTSRVMSDKPRDRFTDLLTRLLRVPKREINAKEQQYPDASALSARTHLPLRRLSCFSLRAHGLSPIRGPLWFWRLSATRRPAESADGLTSRGWPCLAPFFGTIRPRQRRRHAGGVSGRPCSGLQLRQHRARVLWTAARPARRYGDTKVSQSPHSRSG